MRTPNRIRAINTQPAAADRGTFAEWYCWLHKVDYPSRTELMFLKATYRSRVYIKQTRPGIKAMQEPEQSFSGDFMENLFILICAIVIALMLLKSNS